MGMITQQYLLITSILVFCQVSRCHPPPGLTISYEQLQLIADICLDKCPDSQKCFRRCAQKWIKASADTSDELQTNEVVAAPPTTPSYKRGWVVKPSQYYSDERIDRWKKGGGWVVKPSAYYADNRSDRWKRGGWVVKPSGYYSDTRSDRWRKRGGHVIKPHQYYSDSRW